MKTLVLCCAGDCGEKFDAGQVHGDGREEDIQIDSKQLPPGWQLQAKPSDDGGISMGFWCPKCRTDLN